jgi:hypothetical protein
MCVNNIAHKNMDLFSGVLGPLGSLFGGGGGGSGGSDGVDDILSALGLPTLQDLVKDMGIMLMLAVGFVIILKILENAI